MSSGKAANNPLCCCQSLSPTPTPFVCEDNITAVVSGITFGTCGCQISDTSGFSYNETEVTDINKSVTLPLGAGGDCPCAWLNQDDSVSHEVVRNTDCSGGIIFDGGSRTNYFVIIDSGTIYVFIYAGSTVVFYGTDVFTAFPVTINNTITGCGTSTFDSAIADTCYFFGERYTIGGYGGSVTVSMP